MRNGQDHLDDPLDYLYEELPPERMAEVRRHLAECPECRARVREIRDTVKAYRRLPRPVPPAGLAARVAGAAVGEASTAHAAPLPGDVPPAAAGDFLPDSPPPAPTPREREARMEEEFDRLKAEVRGEMRRGWRSWFFHPAWTVAAVVTFFCALAIHYSPRHAWRQEALHGGRDLEARDSARKIRERDRLPAARPRASGDAPSPEVSHAPWRAQAWGEPPAPEPSRPESAALAIGPAAIPGASAFSRPEETLLADAASGMAAPGALRPQARVRPVPAARPPAQRESAEQALSSAAGAANAPRGERQARTAPKTETAFEMKSGTRAEPGAETMAEARPIPPEPELAALPPSVAMPKALASPPSPASSPVLREDADMSAVQPPPAFLAQAGDAADGALPAATPPPPPSPLPAPAFGIAVPPAAGGGDDLDGASRIAEAEETKEAAKEAASGVVIVDMTAGMEPPRLIARPEPVDVPERIRSLTTLASLQMANGEIADAWQTIAMLRHYDAKAAETLSELLREIEKAALAETEAGSGIEPGIELEIEPEAAAATEAETEAVPEGPAAWSHAEPEPMEPERAAPPPQTESAPAESAPESAAPPPPSKYDALDRTGDADNRPPPHASPPVVVPEEAVTPRAAPLFDGEIIEPPEDPPMALVRVFPSGDPFVSPAPVFSAAPDVIEEIQPFVPDIPVSAPEPAAEPPSSRRRGDVSRSAALAQTLSQALGSSGNTGEPDFSFDSMVRDGDDPTAGAPAVIPAAPGQAPARKAVARPAPGRRPFTTDPYLRDY